MHADLIFETNYGANFKLCVFFVPWLYAWLIIELIDTWTVDWLLLSNRFAWVVLVFIIIIFYFYFLSLF